MSNEEEYMAQAYQVAGFALMSPFGRMCLQPTVVFNEFNLIGFISYACFSVLAFLFGMISIEKGRAILNPREGKEN